VPRRVTVIDSTTDLLRTIRRRTDETSTDMGREALGVDSKESDLELMGRAQAGDRQAFGALFQRRSPAIWQMAYLLLHSADAAEDVVQETFARAFEHVGDFRGESEPRSWLSAIALNACRRMIRKKISGVVSADASRLEMGQPMTQPKRGVLTSLLRRETNRRLALALGFLTEPQREVFVLHYVEELPYEEVARLLETTPGAARALSQRARTILQEKLKGDATSVGIR
jgi:RNA polymerase sigma-70 factor (ECF subfamily)